MTNHVTCLFSPCKLSRFNCAYNNTLQKGWKILNLCNMISRLILTNFRNHISCRFTTGTHRNIIITGANGTGKTAIIEAVSMLAGDRGMRGVPMTDIARFDGDGGFSVIAELCDDTEICVYFNRGDSNRHARVDGDAETMVECASKGNFRSWMKPT